jgi:UDP-2,3-diacylglucosamine hydrolase
MQQGLVVSDLHFFSRRSDGQELWSGIDDELRQADVLVLNGDTFDFRWSHFPSEEAAVSAALNWVRELVEGKRYAMVHYVFGNHDCLGEFKSRLEAFAQGCDGLLCHEYLLQLGQNLFLHGDCANRRMDREALLRYREDWSRDRPRGPLQKALYDGVDAIGISRCFHEIYFSRKSTVARVCHYLNHVMPAWRDEVDHCYFGHTHRPFTNHKHEGVEFHNTGSGIRGMGFQPLAFSHDSE